MAKLKAASKAYSDFKKGQDSNDLSKSLRCMIDSNANISRYLSRAIHVNQKLLSGAAIIRAKIRALQVSGNLPGAEHLSKYMTDHLDIYLQNVSTLDHQNKKMNSLSHISAPGADYGLKPFDDIMLDYDCRVLVWNEEDLGFELADDMHPCRKVPGSAWGKMIYDRSTPGSFFSKEPQNTVEWSHVAPTKRLLEDTFDALTRALPQQRKNRSLAADTGLFYPVHDVANIEREVVDYDVEKLVNEPFFLTASIISITG
uniref:MAT1-1-2 n=1 Tax=Leptographium procerum TaxID=100367 RepID=S5SWN2_9PEZI|nr:MAT1-1-2 [Leptographium procerum]